MSQMNDALTYSSTEARNNAQQLVFFPAQLGMLSLLLTSDCVDHFSFLESYVRCAAQY